MASEGSMLSSLDLTALNNLEFVVPTLSEEFRCLVCELILFDDPQGTTCGHHFCKRCVERLVKEQPEAECPKCKEGSFQGVDRVFEKKIKSSRVYCVSRQDGCRWIGELVALGDHLHKECVRSFISCKFEPFGCKAKLLRKDVDAHMISHVVEQSESQQRSLDRLLQRGDAKIKELEQRIDRVKSDITGELKKKSDVKWSPVSPYRLFSVGAGNRCGVQQCKIPLNLVPGQAREILLLVACHSGSASPKGVTHCLSLFVEENGVRYAKYIHITTHGQSALNDNTENMWLPMPTDRMLQFDVPQVFSGIITCNVILTGYR